jgi:rubredoxin
VSQAYPIDIAREIDRRWQRRSNIAPAPRTENENRGRCCPVCNMSTSIAPSASALRGKELLHHQWLCPSCGHDGMTVHRVCA